MATIKGNTKNLTGKTFGKLTVMHYVGSNKHQKAIWHVRCECGNEKDVISGSLLSGNTLSCGCLQKEKAKSSIEKLHENQWSNNDFREFKRNDMKERFTTHGARSRSNPDPIYDTWHGMICRCNSVSSYIRKGIKVCGEWKKSFITFRDWALANGYEKGKHLDRIDNKKNYEPDNCQFLTEKEHRNKTSREIKDYFAERRVSHE